MFRELCEIGGGTLNRILNARYIVEVFLSHFCFCGCQPCKMQASVDESFRLKFFFFVVCERRRCRSTQTKDHVSITRIRESELQRRDRMLSSRNRMLV